MVLVKKFSIAPKYLSVLYRFQYILVQRVLSSFKLSCLSQFTMSRSTARLKRVLQFDVEEQEPETRPTTRQRRAPQSDHEEQEPEDLQAPHLAESSRQRAASGGKHSTRKVRIQYERPQVGLNLRGLTQRVSYLQIHIRNHRITKLQVHRYKT